MPKKLFLEPHFGDIAWSCGGLLAQSKNDSIIVNIFSSKMDKALQRRYKGFNYRHRKQEEEQFQKLFGIEIIYLHFKMALYRGRSFEDLFDKNPNKFEQKQILQLRDKIIKIISKKDIKELYCPKATRNHIDHVIVRQAVELLLSEDIAIYYYEDFPNFLEESGEKKDYPRLREIKVDISDVIEEKIQAVLLYKTLIKAFFKSGETLEELIRKRPYEAIWRKVD